MGDHVENSYKDAIEIMNLVSEKYNLGWGCDTYYTLMKEFINFTMGRVICQTSFKKFITERAEQEYLLNREYNIKH